MRHNSSREGIYRGCDATSGYERLGGNRCGSGGAVAYLEAKSTLSSAPEECALSPRGSAR